VKVRFAINLGTDDFQLTEVEKLFTNEKNPIEARKEAYSHYASYLDVFKADASQEVSIMNKLLAPIAEHFEKTGKIPSDFPQNLGIGLYFFSDDEDLLTKQEDYFIMGWNDSFSEPKNLELEKKIYDI